MSGFHFSIIKGDAVYRRVHCNFPDCLEVVRNAYLAHHEHRTSNPPSVFLKFPDRPNARIIALPAHIGDPSYVSGIKWIASYPDNVTDHFPRASAVLLLNSHKHGYPFACLEASVISAARTAASAVLAAKYLAGKCQAEAFGIVGTGLIARYVYRFLLGTGWNINTVHLYDAIPAESRRFADQVCESSHHSAVRIHSTSDSLLRSCDLILFATVAAQPHVHDFRLISHRPVILHISLRDLAPELLLQSHNIVDDVEHVMQAETSPHLAQKLSGGRDFVNGTLADVMTGRCTLDHSRPVIFSPFGLGLLDVAVGKWVYDGAVAAGEAITLTDFFFDLQR